MADLTLTGAIPGLLRRGSPAWWRDEETPYVVTISYRDADHAEWVVAAPCAGLPIGVQDDPSNFTLDLTDPTGRYHALLWLRERGHDLRWAEDEAEVLAWSVLSVARGGQPLTFIFAPWFTHAAGGCDDREMERPIVRRQFVNYIRAYHAGSQFGGWSHTLSKFKVHRHGPETGDAGKLAADTAALRSGYALRNADGSLTLPELPPVTP